MAAKAIAEKKTFGHRRRRPYDLPIVMPFPERGYIHMSSNGRIVPITSIKTDTRRVVLLFSAIVAPSIDEIINPIDIKATKTCIGRREGARIASGGPSRGWTGAALLTAGRCSFRSPLPSRGGAESLWTLAVHTIQFGGGPPYPFSSCSRNV